MFDKTQHRFAGHPPKQTVSEISKHFNCSRTTVYKQQDKALDAANKVFEQDDEEVLFYIPVTKSFIHESAVALRLICESSYRNIQFYIQAMYNYHVSLGGIFNIIDNAADNAKPINQSYDLSLIKDSASDELFHYDHFHIIMDLKDCGKFLSNKEASAVTVALNHAPIEGVDLSRVLLRSVDLNSEQYPLIQLE